jgi:hypothetical protein
MAGPTAQGLIAQLLAQREHLLDLPGCKARVRVRRPAETDMPTLRRTTAAEVAFEHVVGWEGMTRHLLLGDDNGDPVEFDPELWRVACADKSDWVKAVVTKVGELVKAHLATREAAAKN